MDVELLAEPKTDVSDMERNSTYLDFSDDSSIELAGFSGNKITIEKNTDNIVFEANPNKGPNNKSDHSSSKRGSRKRNKR